MVQNDGRVKIHPGVGDGLPSTHQLLYHHLRTNEEIVDLLQGKRTLNG